MNWKNKEEEESLNNVKYDLYLRYVLCKWHFFLTELGFIISCDGGRNEESCKSDNHNKRTQESTE